MLAWLEHVACRTHHPELFYDPDARGTALHVCWHHCPVMRQCQAWAHAEAERRPASMPAWPNAVVGGEYWTVGRHHVARPSEHGILVETRHCRACRGDQAEPVTSSDDRRRREVAEVAA